MKRGFYFLVNMGSYQQAIQDLLAGTNWHLVYLANIKKNAQASGFARQGDKKGEEKLQTASNKLIAGDQKQTGDLGCNG
jgi:hypothetical protein